MRRIIVGSTAAGRSVILADEELAAQPMPQTPFASIWSADAPPTVSADLKLPETTVDFLPAPGGIRVVQFSVLPNAEVGRVEDNEIDLIDMIPDGPETERAATLVKAVQFVDRPPGLHQTDTVDLVMIISGEMYMLLDDGVEVLLRQGDWVVQNGAPHAWDNRSSAPCVAALVVIGAHIQR
jgi:hypothetical protein